jgi:RNA polymerase sigma-70 factor, ECF subfamily
MSGFSDVEDRVAALLAAGAPADAATAIVRGYGPGILGWLAALLGDDEAAREVFSAFGEELWRALPRFERRSSAKTWAYAIAWNCARRWRRTRARRRTRPLRDSEYSKIAASVAEASRTFARTAAGRRLDALRRTLSDEEQALLVLRLDREMEWRDIARVLGEKGAAAPAALRKRYQRLRERLRRAAEAEGLLSRRP